VLGTWAVVEQVLQWPAGGTAQPRRRVLTVLAASGLTGLPWVVYDYWLVTTHPALKSWSLQNVTPSPSLVAYLVGFGPLVLWSALALVRARPLREPSLRLVATWAVVGIVLLYLPFGLQRRLSLGLAIPLAALAGVGIDRLCRNPARKRLAVIGTILVAAPSLLLVVGAGFASATTAASPTVLSEAEIKAYDWMAENLPPDSLVLAAMQTGNRIPAWMSALVLAGHPFETPDAQAELAWIARAYGWQADPASGLAMLKQRGIEYVYRGREERALGDPTWLQALTPVYTSGEVSLYSVVP
ncbi:MAG: hypothetical protein MUO23_11125, partial [Anaerolineales bacterium]|nr:hypothetical protein [Anaerolineales bacterium]